MIRFISEKVDAHELVEQLLEEQKCEMTFSNQEFRYRNAADYVQGYKTGLFTPLDIAKELGNGESSRNYYSFFFVKTF